MVNLEDLWIGDQVKLIADGRVATFQGLRGAKALIKLANTGAILLKNPSDLQIYSVPIEQEIITFENPQSTPLNFHNIPTEIDLHYEKLNPSNATNQPQDILRFQISKLNNYLDQVQEYGLKIITIIHGKGSGILKNEVLFELNKRKGVKLTLDKNDGGAIEVFFY